MENIQTPILKCLSCDKKMRPIKRDYLFIKNGVNKRTRCKKCYKEYLHSC